MNNRDRYYMHKKAGIVTLQTPQERIESLVKILLAALFIPKENCHVITVPDWNRIKQFGIDTSEPINWGDLSCVVELISESEDTYAVIIDEAAPNACPTLCDYISRHINSYGWKVTEVKTEW